MKVLLDTSTAIEIFMQKLNFDSYDWVIISPVIKELEGLSKGRSKKAIAAKVALEISNYQKGKK